MIGFMDHRPPAGEALIRAYEKTIGSRFPDAYRNFLLTRDGGDPDSNVLLDRHGQPTDVGIATFLSLARGSDEMSVAEAREHLHADVDAAWLPIGIIEGGAYLLLGILPPAAGLAAIDIAHAGQLEIIARDFDDLLDRLVDFAPYMPEIDWSQVKVTKGPAAE